MEKQRWEESERRSQEVRRSGKRERVGSKKIQVREKVGKSRFTVFFQWFGAPEGRKVTSLKRRVRSQLARWEMKDCTPLWREAHFQVKNCTKHARFGPLLEVEMSKKCTPLWREANFQVKMQNTPTSDHFWKFRCRKSARRCGAKHISKLNMYKTHHAVAARSKFPSQNAQSTPTSDHFWKLRCRKSARRCGAKHISKSKWTKHARFGPLLEVEMSKKCTPLRREAHFQVKMQNTPTSDHFWKFRCRKSAHRCGAKQISKSKCKTHQPRTTFGSSDVEKVHAVVARSTFPSQNIQSTPGSDHFWKLRCRKSARRCGAKQISKAKCKTHQPRTTFGSSDVEKVHAVVAPSTFPS